MPPLSVESALIAGRAVFLVFCFVLAAIAFTRWRRAADRSATQFAEQNARLLEAWDRTAGGSSDRSTGRA